MSFEEDDHIPKSHYDEGDKICTIKPDHVYTIFPDAGYIANHHKQAQSFYVEIIPADALCNPPKPQRWIIHLMPLSRRDDLAPAP